MKMLISNDFNLSDDVIEQINIFLKNFKPLETQKELNCIVLRDNCSGANYINCHLNAKILAKKTDLDAVLDPEESEENKLNRNIYKDTLAYQKMEEDAIKGRSFEDLVIEYDVSYRKDKPLKVFGGQHRIMAIIEALNHNVDTYHGARVYFLLSKEQRYDIATANNTSIAVSNDLLDRMQEDTIGVMLRDWSQSVGILESNQNFSDKRSSVGIPTVRVVRTLLVNFHIGKSKGIHDYHMPIVCKTGIVIDEHYNSLLENIDWENEELMVMGKEFADLHIRQRQAVLSRIENNYLEFANKAIHPCVTASWAYAAGLLQYNHDYLDNHYLLSRTTADEDPLNAAAILKARLKGVDPDTYRGLGARINSTELGRMLEVFLIQATKASKRGITLKIANAGIKSYAAKRMASEAEKATKGI